MSEQSPNPPSPASQENIDSELTEELASSPTSTATHETTIPQVGVSTMLSTDSNVSTEGLPAYSPDDSGSIDTSFRENTGSEGGQSSTDEGFGPEAAIHPALPISEIENPISRFQNLEITVTPSTPEKEQEDENMNLERALPTGTAVSDNISDAKEENTAIPITRTVNNNTNGNITTHTQPQPQHVRITQMQELVEKWEILCDIQLSTDILDLNGYDPKTATTETPPPFPEETLKRLDDLVNKPHWIIPVLPNSELEHLLKACIMLAELGVDTFCDSSKKFYREGLTISFQKVLTDDAVYGWKHHIQMAINDCLLLLVRLCAVKMLDDDLALLELLHIGLFPSSRFHMFNAAKLPRTVRVTHHFHHHITHEKQYDCIPESDAFSESLYSYCPEGCPTRGWLVDLINIFGRLGGFDKLKKRICNPTKDQEMNLILLCLLVKPWGNCAEYLTQTCLNRDMLPVVEMATEYLENLTDEDLKKESGKTESSRTDAFSSTLIFLKSILKKIREPRQDLIERIDHLRLEMILRLLRLSSFSGKMNALNELNKIISNVASGGMYYQGPRSVLEDDWLNAHRLVNWLKDHEILKIVLKDNLHQAQYVDKLVRLLRFIIKEQALTIDDLNDVWRAQTGKHDIIVKNIYDLLAKVAWDFSPEQLDHLFQCFQSSWTGASKSMQEKLIEFIRRLAEDDKEGMMAQKVLGLLWNLAHSPDCPTDILDSSLYALTKILEYSCSLDRETQKTLYIRKCIEEIQSNTWVLPAIKLARDLCCLFSEASSNFVHHQVVSFRGEMLRHLDNNYQVLTLLADNLSCYMDYARSIRENLEKDQDKGDSDKSPINRVATFPDDLIIDGHYSHTQQIKERLSFIRFILKDGQLWLALQQAIQIWVALTEKSVYLEDMEHCFMWFSRLVGDDPDLEGSSSRTLFTQYILDIKPQGLSELGMKCFEKFFKYVNYNEDKLTMRRRGWYQTNSLELVGLDYLWKLIMVADESIAQQGIELLKEIFTNFHTDHGQADASPHLQLILSCMTQLQEGFDKLQEDIAENSSEMSSRRNIQSQEAEQVTRCLTLLRGFFDIMDEGFEKERVHFPPHGRSARGRPFTFIIKPTLAHNRNVEEFEVFSHSNDTVGSVRRQIQARMMQMHSHQQSISIDIGVNGELLPGEEDFRQVVTVPLKDKSVINVKVSGYQSANSSPETSSDDEGIGHTSMSHTQKSLKEQNLPSVLFVQNKQRYLTAILFKLCDFAVVNGYANIRDGVRLLLKLLPTDPELQGKVKKIFQQISQERVCTYEQLLALFLSTDSCRVLYMLEIIHALLLPANETSGTHLQEFPKNFVHGYGIRLVSDLLINNQFMSGSDYQMKKAAYITLLKCSKLLYTSVANARLYRITQQIKRQEKTPPNDEYNAALQLQEALKSIPNPNAETILRNFAKSLGTLQGIAPEPQIDWNQLAHALIRLSWGVSLGVFPYLKDISKIEVGKIPKEQPSFTKLLEGEEITLAKEAIESLCIILTLIPDYFPELAQNQKEWRNYVLDILLRCRMKAVRTTAFDQFNMIIMKSAHPSIPVAFVELLVSALETTAKDHAHTSAEYFKLLCRLLSYAYTTTKSIPNVDELLLKQLKWLNIVREGASSPKKIIIEGPLLEGHLNLTVELMQYQSNEKKIALGSSEGDNLIVVILKEFIMPASYMMRRMRDEDFDPDPNGDVTAICTSQDSVIAAFKLIRSLCTGCNENLSILSNELFSLYYSTKDCELTMWEYYPMMGPRPSKGFVGLKNAGATCYMNSVIQQLFMIPAIQSKIISLPKNKFIQPEVSVEENVTKDGENLTKDGDNLTKDGDNLTKDGENVTKDDEKLSNDTEVSKDKETNKESTPEVQNIDLERRAYHVAVLAEMQAIFGHLLLSKLQYYTPQGFWKAFKLWGEPVNLKEQHDALEFYNSLVDSLDEGTKFIFGTKGASTELGGNFASQKICKDCPHRYVKEEQFTALSIEVRNQSHLQESLDLFVKGDLLEGNNAFFCEKCDKKVDTIMRTCIRHLPKVLVIQLKRFDYDWERETAIKFNDYFEFPRDLDLAPYTEYYLAKKEGETIPETSDDKPACYSLSGIVVHSGQAYGGHYYSFVRFKCNSGETKWFKFDDMEVTECRMDDYEELRSNCFGGEFQGEVYDPVAKRMQFRRQKRWWNAYLLVYERVEEFEAGSDEKSEQTKAPYEICKSVQRENLDYMFTKVQFGIEYFGFMKDLFKANKNFILDHLQDSSLTGPTSKNELESLALLSIQLASRFLFTIGFHTKKSLRGLANEWYECYQALINNYACCRKWLADEILFKKPMFRFCEYLLDCPSPDIRVVFTKILVCLAKFSITDGTYDPPRVEFGPHNLDEDKRDEEEQESHSFSLLLRSTKPQTLPVPDPILPIDLETSELRDHIMISCINLLAYDLSPCAKYLSQYFGIFQMYCKLGRTECDHLLRLGVPELFMAAALHEGPGPPIISQSLDLTKLFTFVAILLRCYDIVQHQESANKDEQLLDNPFKNGEPFCVIPENIQSKLFSKPTISLHTNYVKKMLEECSTSEECILLLKFCCWENWEFSVHVISEIIFELGNSHNYELRQYMDLMLHILMLEDSWQRKRVMLTLKGIPNEIDSLFDIIHNLRLHYQKRAYLALKLILQIVQFCPFTKDYLMGDYAIKRRYMIAVDWLNDELNRRMMSSAYSNYGNTWPHSTSNESSTNSLFLERTHSAQSLLANAKVYYVPDQVTPPPTQDQDSGDEVHSNEGEKPDSMYNTEIVEDNSPSIVEQPELTSHSSHPDNLDKVGQDPPSKTPPDLD